MKAIYLCLFIFVISFATTGCYATSQIPDFLYYRGGTLQIYTNPLEYHLQIDSLRPKLFGKQKGGNSTACWREYIAYWELKNKKLYLVNIASCDSYEDQIVADLKSLFKKKFMDGKVFADWFTGTISSPRGKLIHYVHMGYESIYEKDVEYNFVQGKFKDSLVFNNRGKETIYTRELDSLPTFIYSNIKWEGLPQLSRDSSRVIVQFSGNEKGVVDSVKVIRGFNKELEYEAIRVIKLLPEWDTLFYHGEFIRCVWVMPILFNEEFRQKYSKNKSLNSVGK